VDAHARGRLPLDASDGEGVTDEFRRIVGARYRLLPYIYAQVRLCLEGPPDARALFFEYPEDPVSCTVEDE
jgi:alpha-glucosidase (family GH31 glycosyl hydrolase)